MPSRPTGEELDILVGRLDGTCRKVAEALWRADVFLVCTGAGFSADSGLAVYKDIAELEAYQDLGIRYHDICRPEWLQRDPELFYGFWGTCYNDYRETQPHEGYDLLRRWRDARFVASQADRAVRSQLRAEEASKRAAELEAGEEGRGASTTSRSSAGPYPINGCAGAFFLYTSNVDAHSFDYFAPCEVREVHGNTEVWQCGAEPRPCSRRTWRAPLDFRFTVDQRTMRAPALKDGILEGAKPRSTNASTTGPPGGKAASTKPVAEAPQCSNATTNEPEQKAQTNCEEGCVENCEGGNGKARAGHVLRPFGKRVSPLNQLPEVGEEAAAAFSASGSNHPRCPHCGGPARPAILMFSDLGWVSDQGQELRWSSWRRAVSTVAQAACQYGRRVRILILEIGCGGNVPTVRHAVECAAADFAADADVTVARINVDFPLPDKLLFPSGHMRHLALPCRGLEALQRIQRHYESMPPEQRREHSDEELQLGAPPAALPSRSRSRSGARSPSRGAGPGQPAGRAARSKSRGCKRRGRGDEGAARRGGRGLGRR